MTEKHDVECGVCRYHTPGKCKKQKAGWPDVGAFCVNWCKTTRWTQRIWAKN